MSKSKLTPYQRKLKEMRKDERLTDAVKQKAAIQAISTLYVMLVYTMYIHYGWKNQTIKAVADTVPADLYVGYQRRTKP